ncbi:MAG: FAD-dependent oxidoreductase [Candidatus Binatota bacterium]|nr:FAD-dependent oxidoreductase [Candidatus Binatota bacterium]
MAAVVDSPVNALSILALKVKENTFDLGSFLKHISIRDQVIRGQILARDLVEGAQLHKGDHVLIVGAGAAGLAVAEALLHRDCSVLIIEKGDEPLTLWRGVTDRFVGPYMYEWPSSFYGDQHFPPIAPSVLSSWPTATAASASGLTFPSADPMSADDLRKHWLNAISGWRATWGLQVQVLFRVVEGLVTQEIQNWRNDVRASRGKPTYAMQLSGTDWLSQKPTTANFAAKIVIIAAGFGREDTALPPLSGKKFWGNDSMLDRRARVTGMKPVRVAVFGGGDGALQDTLRALTQLQTPLDLLDSLRAKPVAHSALVSCMESLAAIERQHESAAPWERARPSPANPQMFATLDKACRDQAQIAASEPQLVFELLGLERSDVDEVHLVVREPYFGKAYMLNRFLVLLFEECGKKAPSKLHVHWSAELASSNQHTRSPATYDLGLTNGKTLVDINVVAIRLGLEKGSVPGQYLGLTKRDTVNRRELAELKLPFWALH